MNEVMAGVRSRNRVRRPCESIATPGQNVSSKTKNTLRRAMMRWRWQKPHVRPPSARTASACELNEHLFQLGILDAAIAHQHRLLVEPAQDLGQPLLRRVHRALHALPAHVELEHP